MLQLDHTLLDERLFRTDKGSYKFECTVDLNLKFYYANKNLCSSVLYKLCVIKGYNFPVIKFNFTVLYLKFECIYIYMQILKSRYTKIRG